MAMLQIQDIIDYSAIYGLIYQDNVEELQKQFNTY